MSDASGRTGNPSNVRSLTDALRRVRLAEADRSDVAVDLRDAEQTRLEMLADELREVFAEVPQNDDQFIFSVAPGPQPRLWIDMTAFVAVARDRRTYRFLKDTRLGRTVIVESATIDDVADTITNYVAERIIERERAIEGDWLIRRLADDEGRRGRIKPARQPGQRRPLNGRNLGWIVAGFLAGVLVGAALLFAYAWTQVG